MDSAFIHQAANELVQNAGTRNIKQIARSCSLDISETSRIKDRSHNLRKPPMTSRQQGIRAALLFLNSFLYSILTFYR